jgi:hypothetical protein
MDTFGARETRAFASEVKFLVPRATGLAIREWARQHLERDPHGTGPFGDEYRTSTIYFESPDYDVFHRRGSFGRSKYRIRQYAQTAGVFLERKLRRPGMLTKRRTFVPAPSLSRLERAAGDGWAGDWFHRRLLLRRLRPVCEIAYSRTARAGSALSGPIRLTLDERLCAVRTTRPLFGTTEPPVTIAEGCMILELKFRAGVPTLFKQLVEEFRLSPQATSKYRIGIAAVDPDATTAATTGAGAIAPVAVGRPV